MKLRTYSERKMKRSPQLIKESGDYVSAIKDLVADFEGVKKVIKNSSVTAFEVWLELGVKSGAIKEKDAEKLLTQLQPNESVQEAGDHKVIKTIEDKENGRKYEFFKSPLGKLEYKVYNWDDVDGDWDKGLVQDDVEWLKAEENPEIDAFLREQGINEAGEKHDYKAGHIVKTDDGQIAKVIETDSSTAVKIEHEDGSIEFIESSRIKPYEPANEAEGDEAAEGEISPEAEQALGDEIEKALKIVIADLPKDLKALSGPDKELELAPVLDKEADKELNEAIGALLAGGALALPAITQILGKTVKWAGGKLGSDDVESWGKAVEHFGHELHHKYEGVLDKMLSPFTKNLDPEKRKVINKVVFYSIVAVLGGAGLAGAVKAAGAGQAGLAAIEGGLTSVKATELASVAKEIIPKVLSKMVG